ncbi:hypothetical protein F4778DRAFT_745592 [Xylariomycetidae sp. FL2044]|nr:hypothetical protein F4778DRAFT_745592 [Xylariomycetidae sp. FL2044]
MSDHHSSDSSHHKSDSHHRESKSDHQKSKSGHHKSNSSHRGSTSSQPSASEAARMASREKGRQGREASGSSSEGHSRQRKPAGGSSKQSTGSMSTAPPPPGNNETNSIDYSATPQYQGGCVSHTKRGVNVVKTWSETNREWTTLSEYEEPRPLSDATADYENRPLSYSITTTLPRGRVLYCGSCEQLLDGTEFIYTSRRLVSEICRHCHEGGIRKKGYQLCEKTESHDFVDCLRLRPMIEFLSLSKNTIQRHPSCFRCRSTLRRFRRELGSDTAKGSMLPSYTITRSWCESCWKFHDLSEGLFTLDQDGFPSASCEDVSDIQDEPTKQVCNKCKWAKHIGQFGRINDLEGDRKKTCVDCEGRRDENAARRHNSNTAEGSSRA